MITIDKNKNLEFKLKSLNKSVKLDEFINLEVPLAQKAIEHKLSFDPRDDVQALRELQRIHEQIEKATKNLNDQREQALAQYCLAGMFQMHFARYDLDQEVWQCRLPWLHLLRMKYHALARLIRLEALTETQTENHYFPALRDWRDFCLEDKNQFLFKKQNGLGLGSPEEEIKGIICGYDPNSESPLPFFLKSPDGKRVLDRLIEDWFLRDRYDWFGALRLGWFRFKHWFMTCRWIYRATLGLSFSVLILLIWWAFPLNNWIKFWLTLSYWGGAMLIVCGFFQRITTDLLLPRLCAGIMVGYLPLMLTGEVWTALYQGNHGLTSIVAFDIFTSLLSLFYLRWEVANKLVRPPGLSQWLILKRAGWLLVWGLAISFSFGLILFDTIGRSLGQASYGQIIGIFGPLYWEAWLLFAPLALFIGVLLQIFWMEKPVTHPA